MKIIDQTTKRIVRLLGIVAAMIAAVVLFGCSELSGSPDLTVAPGTIAPSNLTIGGAFTFSATVTNAGNGASAASTLTFYQSTDAAIDPTSDTAVGSTVAVSALAAGATSNKTIDLTAPNTPGHPPLRRLCGQRSRRDQYPQQLLHRCAGDGFR